MATLDTSVPTNLEGLEIPNIPRTPKSLDDLQRDMSRQAPTLASMLAFLKTIQAGAGSTGVVGNYKIELTASGIFIGHKDCNIAGLGAGYVGDLRIGISFTTATMSIGYNNKVSGDWAWIANIDSSGNISLLGAHSSGTIDGANVTVSGTTMADIRTGALRANAAINGSNQVVADVVNASVTTGVLGATTSATVLGPILATGNIQSLASMIAPLFSGSLVGNVSGDLAGNHTSGNIDSVSVTDTRIAVLRALAAINSSNQVYGDVVNSSVTTATLGVTSSCSVTGTISATGNIGTSATVSGTIVSGVAVTGGVISASTYFLKPYSLSGRLTVYNQTFPYAAVGTYFYEFHT